MLDMTDDRPTRLRAGHALGLLLGTPEGKAQLDATGWQDDETIVVLLTSDGPAEVQRRLAGREQLVTVAVYEPTTETITFRTPERAHLEAQLREGIAQAERGETVSLGDFSQYLNEPGA